MGLLNEYERVVISYIHYLYIYINSIYYTKKIRNLFYWKIIAVILLYYHISIWCIWRKKLTFHTNILLICLVICQNGLVSSIKGRLDVRAYEDTLWFSRFNLLSTYADKKINYGPQIFWNNLLWYSQYMLLDFIFLSFEPKPRICMQICLASKRVEHSARNTVWYSDYNCIQ